MNQISREPVCMSWLHNNEKYKAKVKSPVKSYLENLGNKTNCFLSADVVRLTSKSK